MGARELALEAGAEAVLHPGHRVDGDGLRALLLAPARPPRRHRVPVRAVAGHVGHEVVTRGQHAPALLAPGQEMVVTCHVSRVPCVPLSLVHHGRVPRQPGALLARVGVEHRAGRLAGQQLGLADLLAAEGEVSCELVV